jgi:hypothetical protein
LGTRRTHDIIRPVLALWNLSANRHDPMRSRPAGFPHTSSANDHWVEPEDRKRMILKLNSTGMEDLPRAWNRAGCAAPVPAGACGPRG